MGNVKADCTRRNAGNGLTLPRAALLQGLMLLQGKIKKFGTLGEREGRMPSGDFSKYLPDGDPLRRELESLFPPFVKA